VFPRQITGIIVVVLWVAGIAAGFGALQRYSSKAGPAQAPDRRAEKHLASYRHPGRAVLVMAIHPLCPCTDASLAELGDLLARSRGGCDAVLLQYHPSDGTPEWPVDTTPRLLGGVKVPVVLDRGGEIASAIGAETSGHAVLVDAAGKVRFHGGLTIARSHRGRSPAQDAILEVLAGGHPTMTTAPVYGCTLECAPEVFP
jgi:hypothetical protein